MKSPKPNRNPKVRAEAQRAQSKATGGPSKKLNPDQEGGRDERVSARRRLEPSSKPESLRTATIDGQPSPDLVADREKRCLDGSSPAVAPTSFPVARSAGDAADAESGAPVRCGAPEILVPSAASPQSILLPYQLAWVRDSARFKIGVWSRQTGKDFSSGCEIVEDCLKTKRATWLIGAAGERQALETLEKCKEWAEAYRLQVEDYAEDRDYTQALMKSAEIRWSNGSRVKAVPANPQTVRGFSGSVLMTEFAFIENPSETWRAMFPTITNPLRGGEKKLRIISTPNGKANKFAELWEKQNKWSKHLVTIYDAVKQGLPVNIDELREMLDDPEGWAQEFECLFLETSNILLPYDLIAAVESADATEFGLPVMTTSTRLVNGIDFGRTNDPTVCWTDELIGDVAWTREVLALQSMSTPDQEEKLISRVEAAGRTCLDYTGPGIGLGDYLVKRFGEWNPKEHKYGKIELCTFTTKFKRELFPAMRRKFEERKVRIPISVAIREDLHAMRQIVQNGEYSYWAPRGKEGHSDRCTAKALATRAAGEAVQGITSTAGMIVGKNTRTSQFQPRRLRPSKFGVEA